MRFAIAASALFAGLAAAVPAVTMTAYSTEVDTITSCGPEVTNCPARQQSSTATSAPAVVTSSSMAGAVTPAPFPSAGNSTASVQSTIYLYSTETLTITSCAATVTNCPARTSLTSSIVGTTVVPVAALSSSAVSPVAPYPVASNGTSNYAPTASAPSASSGIATAYPSAYTGAASHLNAGMALAGVGAFAALLL